MMDRYNFVMNQNKLHPRDETIISVSFFLKSVNGLPKHLICCYYYYLLLVHLVQLDESYLCPSSN